MKTAVAGVAIAFVAALAGCSNGDNSGSEQASETTHPETPTTPESTTTIEASTPATLPTVAEPNIGETALRIGETRRGLAIKTRLITFRYPYPPGQYREPAKGKQFFGLKVRQCLRSTARTSTEPIYSTYNGDWYIVSPIGAQFTGSVSWDDWPVPKFPEFVTLTPGECLLGWLTIEVPIGTKVAKIVWRQGGQTLAEWLP